MKTVLDYIKDYPEEFIASAERRVGTTPSEINRIKHNGLVQNILNENWSLVKDLITEKSYRSPLEGVIICLNQYTDLDINICINIHDTFKEGKLV